MRILDGGRISIAAMALGLGEGALEMAVRYAKDRRQFGKSIADFQAVQFDLAEMATERTSPQLVTASVSFTDFHCCHFTNTIAL